MTVRYITGMSDMTVKYLTDMSDMLVRYLEGMSHTTAVLSVIVLIITAMCQAARSKRTVGYLASPLGWKFV